MRQLRLTSNRARGFLLIVAILVVVVVAVAIAALGNMTSADISASSGHNQSEQAYFVAASGLEVAIFQFSHQDVACTTAGLVTPNTGVAVGLGRFNITSATPYPSGAVASTLTGAGITSTSPGIITVSSIANFAPHGRIRIENEEMDYSSTSSVPAICGAPPCFVVWRRGTNGTTASLHTVASTPVFQDNQCLIRSSGMVGNSVRTLEAAVK